ncbi:MAG: alkaline phosphatase family protein [Thaumarchaeota archaeon]|nr:alkaline phosphatase family protein [Nitrososphaerota archaeon]
MLDESLERELTSRRFELEFITPAYREYCLSNVPGTILSLFGVRTQRTLPTRCTDSIEKEDIQTVVLIVVDGLGYDMWSQRRSDGAFFGAMTEEGFVCPLTSVFPSTTAAALTSIYTGLTPQEHGLPEWNVYMKELDTIIATLPFTAMGEGGRDGLLRTADPQILFSGTSIFSTLRDAGVRSLALLKETIAASAYTRTALRGAEVVPYSSLTDMAAKLRKSIEGSQGKTLVYAYWDGIDAVGHAYGPASERCAAELAAFSRVLKEELLDKLSRGSANRTLLVVTADHGQISVSPDETLYLNTFGKVVSSFKTSDAGRSILPTWSPRDVALYIEDEKLEYVLDYLSGALTDRAVVMRTQDAINNGLFGLGTPSRRFIDRAGNLLILPRGNGTIWYEHKAGRKFDLLGLHGGLTEGELLIPFAISSLSRLLEDR